jgi:hypothetical protein
VTEEHEKLVDELKQLWTHEGDLSFLEDVPLHALVKIRDAALAHAQRVHDSQRNVYKALAATTRFVPNFLSVKLAGSFSPYVMAQVSEFLEPKTAALIAKSLDLHILTEVVLYMRAETAASIAAHQDFPTLAALSDALHEKGFFKRLGELGDALAQPVIEKLLRHTEDPAQIAAVASHMESLDKLGRLARTLEPKKLKALRRILAEQGHQRALLAISAN